jgi:hypothetical protein
MHVVEEQKVAAKIRSTRLHEDPRPSAVAAQRSTNRPPVQSPIKPCFDVPEGLFRGAPVGPKKKQVKRPRIGSEVATFDGDQIERETMEEIAEFQLVPNHDSQIEADKCSRRFRVDAGTAVCLRGEKSWRVSAEGEFYIPRGENAMISAFTGDEVTIREFAT